MTNSVIEFKPFLEKKMVAQMEPDTTVQVPLDLIQAYGGTPQPPLTSHVGQAYPNFDSLLLEASVLNREGRIEECAIVLETLLNQITYINIEDYT